MASKIFENAANVEIGSRFSLVQTISQAGRYRGQIRAPYLYSFQVTVSTLLSNSDTYFEVDAEIRGMNYGANTITTTIPSNLIKSRGAWLGAPKVKGINQNGSQITLDGFASNVNRQIMDGDYIQFGSSTKVYQAVGNSNSNSVGNVTVQLNTVVAETLVDNEAVTHGSDVEFRLALTGYGNEIRLPSSNAADIVELGSFTFQEVL